MAFVVIQVVSKRKYLKCASRPVFSIVICSKPLPIIQIKIIGKSEVKLEDTTTKTNNKANNKT